MNFFRCFFFFLGGGSAAHFHVTPIVRSLKLYIISVPYSALTSFRNLTSECNRIFPSNCGSKEKKSRDF